MMWRRGRDFQSDELNIRSIASLRHTRSPDMSKGDKLTNHLALSMLGECGIAAIWRLNVAAADAHRSGHPCAAAVILQIAEAAEEAWLRAEGARSLLCCSKSS